MRIRSTKPEFWRSERIASVSWDARLVLKGIESYVDDNGVGKDDLALIVADVFPRDLSRNPTGTLQKVSEALSELSEAGLLWRYDADGTALLFVAFWESVQRIEKPSKGRYPRPDGTSDYRESEIREPDGTAPEASGSVPVALRPGTGEQGNRGTGEKPSSDKPTANANPDLFDEFWSVFPKRVAKQAAQRKWDTIIRRGVDPQQIIDGARAYARQVRGSEPKFIKQPDGWLNAGRWEDEVTQPRHVAPVSSEAEFMRRMSQQHLPTEPAS